MSKQIFAAREDGAVILHGKPMRYHPRAGYIGRSTLSLPAFKGLFGFTPKNGEQISFFVNPEGITVYAREDV